MKLTGKAHEQCPGNTNRIWAIKQSLTFCFSFVLSQATCSEGASCRGLARAALKTGVPGAKRQQPHPRFKMMVAGECAEMLGLHPEILAVINMFTQLQRILHPPLNQRYLQSSTAHNLTSGEEQVLTPPVFLMKSKSFLSFLN